MQYFLYLLLSALLAGCGRAEYSAEYRIPESEITLRLDLKQVNPPLAEYERSLVVVRAGAPLQRVDLGVDIGGYTLVNLYTLPSGEYLLTHDLNPFQRVNPASGVVNPVWWGLPPYETRRPPDALFIGAFDFSDDHVYRFLPASQRAEREVGQLYFP